MTSNNSGGVARYDGLPIPKRPTIAQGESLDDFVLDELEQPIRKYSSHPREYPAIIPAPKYALMKI